MNLPGYGIQTLTNKDSTVFCIVNLNLLTTIQNNKFTVHTVDDVKHLPIDRPRILDEGFLGIFDVMKRVICQPAGQRKIGEFFITLGQFQKSIISSYIM